MERKTPLYEAHLASRGRMVPFAGYLLPVQYEGVIAEHMAVRTACGMFDVSHMGEILCSGRDALANLNHLLTNDYSQMDDGQARYSPMCTEAGTVVDDLIVYKVREHHYFIVVNAANKDKDVQWMKQHAFGDAEFTDISDSVAQIALQGPKAEKILRKLAKPEDIPEKYYSAKFEREIQGVKSMISRTGYTGEDGFELYLPAKEAKKIWDLLLKAGKDEGILPCGLGARDTLRLEAAMPLYGHEMDETVTPLEAGLSMFVKMQKENFIGKEALAAAGSPKVCRVGLKVEGRGIIREGMDLYVGDKKVGRSTSGTHCPYLGRPVAMALVKTDYKEPGSRLEAMVRGKRVAVSVTKLPFYQRKKNQEKGEA